MRSRRQRGRGGEQSLRIDRGRERDAAFESFFPKEPELRPAVRTPLGFVLIYS